MAMTLPVRVLAAIKAAGIAIDDVALGVEADRTTWRVLPSALQAQAQPVIDAFVLPTAAQITDEDAQRDAQMKINLALIAYIYKVTHGGTNPTGAQLNAEVAVVKNIYKAL